MVMYCKCTRWSSIIQNTGIQRVLYIHNRRSLLSLLRACTYTLEGERLEMRMGEREREIERDRGRERGRERERGRDRERERERERQRKQTPVYITKLSLTCGRVW